MCTLCCVAFVSACHMTWFGSEAGRVEFIDRVGPLPPPPSCTRPNFGFYAGCLCFMAGRVGGEPLYSTRAVDFAHAQ